MDGLPQRDSRAGLLYAIAAYGLWGVMPLYFRVLKDVGPLDLLCHRIVWSALLLAGLVTILRRWRLLRACLVDPKTRWLMLASTLLIAGNWYLFIYGVSIGQIVQNSLGYFINPLLNILIGVLLFQERLRFAQWIALLLATGGLAYLVIAGGQVPWIAFSLAGSFAIYGLIRKVAPVETLLALSIETLLLAPASLAVVVYFAWTDQGALGRFGWAIDALLLLSGIVTAVPLYCFGQAARMLKMSTLGFLQYLAPTMQFLIAVLFLHEPFEPTRQISFALIWSALALVSIDSLLAARNRQVRPSEQSTPANSPTSDPVRYADSRIS